MSALGRLSGGLGILIAILITILFVITRTSFKEGFAAASQDFFPQDPTILNTGTAPVGVSGTYTDTTKQQPFVIITRRGALVSDYEPISSPGSIYQNKVNNTNVFLLVNPNLRVKGNASQNVQIPLSAGTPQDGSNLYPYQGTIPVVSPPATEWWRLRNFFTGKTTLNPRFDGREVWNTFTLGPRSQVELTITPHPIFSAGLPYSIPLQTNQPSQKRVFGNDTNSLKDITVEVFLWAQSLDLTPSIQGAGSSNPNGGGKVWGWGNWTNYIQSTASTTQGFGLSFLSEINVTHDPSYPGTLALSPNNTCPGFPIQQRNTLGICVNKQGDYFCSRMGSMDNAYSRLLTGNLSTDLCNTVSDCQVQDQCWTVCDRGQCRTRSGVPATTSLVPAGSQCTPGKQTCATGTNCIPDPSGVNRCLISCPAGQQLNTTTNVCENCPVATQNPTTGGRCQACPPGLTTVGVQTIKELDCVCPPGATKTADNSCKCPNRQRFDSDKRACIPCKNDQVYLDMNNMCWDVRVFPKAPPGTKGTPGRDDVQNCQSVDQGDCTITQKDAAGNTITTNPCTGTPLPVYNFDTNKCEAAAATADPCCTKPIAQAATDPACAGKVITKRTIIKGRCSGEPNRTTFDPAARDNCCRNENNWRIPGCASRTTTSMSQAAGVCTGAAANQGFTNQDGQGYDGQPTEDLGSTDLTSYPLTPENRQKARWGWVTRIQKSLTLNKPKESPDWFPPGAPQNSSLAKV